jgi:hypothetical protein
MAIPAFTAARAMIARSKPTGNLLLRLAAISLAYQRRLSAGSQSLATYCRRDCHGPMFEYDIPGLESESQTQAQKPRIKAIYGKALGQFLIHQCHHPHAWQPGRLCPLAQQARMAAIYSDLLPHLQRSQSWEAAPRCTARRNGPAHGPTIPESDAASLPLKYKFA